MELDKVESKKENDKFNEYREFVSFLSENKIPLKFPNSSSKHAAVVLANILKTSKEVFIYDNHLKGDIAYSHPDFIDALKTFSEDNNKALSIVISPIKEDKEQKLLEDIRKIKPQSLANISIYEHTKTFVDNIFKITNGKELEMSGNINFAVGDNNSYRIERFDSPSMYNANCNFNDTKTATLLSNSIKSNLKYCEEYTL